MHPQTYREMKFILTMLKEEGETKTFSYIKHHILKGKPYPWEENTEE